MAVKQIVFLSALALVSRAFPSPPATLAATSTFNQHPIITPSSEEYLKRGIIDDIHSKIGSELTQFGSSIPTYVADGVADFFQALPSGSAVESSLGISPDQLAALPTGVLLIPPYANWTEQGWNVRFHGNVYKQPNITEDKLNDLANVFLVDTDIESLPASQADEARNLTAEIFVVQQGGVRPTFQVLHETAGGAASIDTIQFPTNTTGEGDFDSFLPISLSGLIAGTQTKVTQTVKVFTEGSSLGNATGYLYPPQGLTVISDIDDILRVTKIYDPSVGLLNSFARPYVPWMNMPEIYANWSTSLAYMGSPVNFHYLTTTPEQITRNYMSFIYATYPPGSFDTRPLIFANVNATLSIRRYLLNKIFETFRQRKFILVADTSNSDVMKDYPQLAKDFPNQVQCIFLRNTSATDSSDHFPYDTSDFEGLPSSLYMFFNVPDDLKNLDIANGQCVNKSVGQDVTFGYQNLPFGINTGDGGSESVGARMFSGTVVFGLYMAMSMSWALVAELWALI